MTDSEIRKCLEVYEREVVKEYDNVEFEKVKLPSDFKKCTLDKVLYEQSDKKRVKVKKSGALKSLTAAVLICVILMGAFASSDISADIFGFDAWEMTYSKQDKSGNATIDYNKTKNSKENGADKIKKRISDVPQYVPRGFKYTNGENDDIWIYREWLKEDKCLYFTREKILKDTIYSGKDVNGKKVNIAGYIGYIYGIEEKNRKLQWNDDEYINSIGTDADIDYDELLKMAESMYEKSHSGLAIVGELQEFEDTYEVRKSLCKGIGTKEIINGSFVDTLAQNYKKQSDAIAEQYDGEEYDKQMKLLDKAFEDASDIVSSSYSRQMRVLTGDIVINRTVKDYSTYEAAEDALSKNDTLFDKVNISREQGEKIVWDVKKICGAAKDSVLKKGVLRATAPYFIKDTNSFFLHT